MPQTGPTLEGAGYPISRPLLALLGGTTNSAQGNVPVKTNLDFGMGGLSDATLTGASTYFMAVPALPGDVITKVSVLVGATYASATSSYAMLYTGTGSAPGTTGAQPTLISSTASTGTWTSAQAPVTWTFTNPVTITATQAPYGFVYVGVQLSATNSLISMACASVAQYQWFSTSPFSLAMTTASVAASVTAIGSATRIANPPIVLLY